MHVFGPPAIENTIPKQWILSFETPEPCIRRGALRSSDKTRWLDSCDAQQSVHNRAPGAVSRPGANLEFQFQKYADLRQGVNNS
jgi:hypothetical protein